MCGFIWLSVLVLDQTFLNWYEITRDEKEWYSDLDMQKYDFQSSDSKNGDR